MKKTIMGLFVFMMALSCFGQTKKNTKVQKEFMYFVYSDGNRVKEMASKEQQLHIKKIGSYIENLAKTGKLKDAQPLEMEGVKISANKHKFSSEVLDKTQKVIAGYYHILAKDLEEAIQIAKLDPRFEQEGWEMEIRPIKKVTGIN